MATLTTTVDHTTGTVTIEASAMPANARLTRYDRNGLQPVRLYEGQDAQDGSLVVTDSELSLFGPVEYRMGGVTATVRLDGVEDPNTRTTTDLIALVSNPGTLAPILLTLSLDAERESLTTEHEVIGRSETIGVTGPLRLRTGTLEFLAADADQAARIEAIYAYGQVALIRFTASTLTQEAFVRAPDLYHTARSVRFTPDAYTLEGRQYWVVSVAFTEKRSPTFPLAGSPGWSYGDLEADYNSYAEAYNRFSTYADLAVGP